MEKWEISVQKALKKALIDADLDYKRLGDVEAQTWRIRINNPGQLRLRDLMYFCRRTHLRPKDIIDLM